VEKKAEPSWEKFGYRDVIPAGQLYTGPWHRSLRLAADALTDQTMIRILSARHGLVPLERPLFPYDTRLGDRDVITPERMARQTAALDLDDAYVIFLGGRNYARLLQQSVPHTLTPLSGGLGNQRAQCHAVSRSPNLGAAWWTAAVRLANRPEEGVVPCAQRHTGATAISPVAPPIPGNAMNVRRGY
jgi:hypothetical protein